MHRKWRFKQRLLLSVLAMSASVGVGAAQFKLATLAPEGTQWMQDMRAAAAEIKERTGGRIIIKLYGGGVQGNEKKVLRKIRIGQLQGGAFTTVGIAEVYPDIVIYGLPMLFESQEEVDFVRQRMDSVLTKGLEQAGFISFGFSGGGFARILANSPVIKAGDMRGRKIWVPEGDRVSYEAMKVLELAPVVLPITDVLTGLQTGLLDVIAAPPVGVVALQWHTRVRYMTRLPLMYTMGLMAVDARAFGAMSPADQIVFRDVMTALYRRFDRQSRNDDLAALNALQANGIEFIAADPAEAQRWRQTMAQNNRRLAREGLYGDELLGQVLMNLEEFHAGGVESGTPLARGQR